MAVFGADEELQEAVAKWMQRGKLDPLLDLWVKGLPVDWHRLHPQPRPQRLHLPSYPFARGRYWVVDGPAPPPVSTATPAPRPWSGEAATLALLDQLIDGHLSVDDAARRLAM